MEQQHRLTPHMKQYEDFALGDIRWLPYVIFFNKPGYASPALHTDSAGFRVSHGPCGSCSLQDAPSAGEVSVLLGSSTAFGLGASGDEHTLPSLLSQGPGGVPWLNLAAPAFNSTQEVVLFLLHRHQLPAVRNIVVFSGLNNLVVAGLPAATADYGQFFFSGPFLRQMGVPEQEEPKWALGRIAQATRRLARGGTPDGKPEILDVAERVEVAARTTVRDLARLQELAAPAGARVHFVLQPTIAWQANDSARRSRRCLTRTTVNDGICGICSTPSWTRRCTRRTRAAWRPRAGNSKSTSWTPTERSRPTRQPTPGSTWTRSISTTRGTGRSPRS